MNFLQEISVVAMNCPDVLQQKLLRDAVMDVDTKLTAAFNDPTTANMQDLVGAWTKAMRVLKNAPPLGGGGDNAGRVRVTEEMRQAA